METIQIQVTKELAQQLRFYQNELPYLLELGLSLIQSRQERQSTSKRPTSINLWDWLDKPVTGQRTREEIDAFLNAERDSWETSQ
ncbi:hypothetical protein [Candidatus Parabeggiatoa sp. HSG14]|uniref:hypothetical protein n=1 Tax=Candidatus Parabeggiatoa sp. HSG14 TaxID=3055593 RepID=UPI0025A69149|nr:hypothetical protein [Thiotrichales bacterium HSG14]